MPFRPQPRKSISVALTIAGSDSGGGAGIQADLKTFAALGVHGTTAVTCITAQNPAKVLAVESVSPGNLEAQLFAVFSEIPPTAIKIGMLYSAELIRVVARFLKRRRGILVVVDPVMVATNGAELLQKNAAMVLQKELLPLATLISPNVSEAEALLGVEIRTPEDLRSAARELHKRFGCAVLAKGGHLKLLTNAVDFFFDGKDELMLSSPRVRGIRTHGTGCTYSAAITAGLAKGNLLADAVIEAKNYITTAIANSRRAGGHFVLGDV